MTSSPASSPAPSSHSDATGAVSVGTEAPAGSPRPDPQPSSIDEATGEGNPPVDATTESSTKAPPRDTQDDGPLESLGEAISAPVREAGGVPDADGRPTPERRSGG